MSRQEYIQPAVKADPLLVAAALRRIATVLDLADDEKVTVFFASLGTDKLTELTAAWSQAAMIIADRSSVTTAELLRVAQSIDKGGIHATLF